MGIQWVTGEVTAIHATTETKRVVATIKGDNGTMYALKDNGWAPEARSHHVSLGDRVKFEDRQGYVMDLRHI